MQTYVPILYMHMGKDTRIFISLELHHLYDFGFLSMRICIYVHIWLVLVLEVELGLCMVRTSSTTERSPQL